MLELKLKQQASVSERGVQVGCYGDARERFVGENGENGMQDERCMAGEAAVVMVVRALLREVRNG